MLTAVQETINPKRGHGMSETFIFIIVLVIIVGIFVLTAMGVEVPHAVTAALASFVGWIVRGNHKQQWDGKERRHETDETATKVENVFGDSSRHK